MTWKCFSRALSARSEMQNGRVYLLFKFLLLYAIFSVNALWKNKLRLEKYVRACGVDQPYRNQFNINVRRAPALKQTRSILLSKYDGF